MNTLDLLKPSNLWVRWMQIRGLLLYNTKQQRVIDITKYTLDSMDDSSEKEKYSFANCALFSFIEKFSVEEIRKLVFSTVEAIRNQTTEGRKYISTMCRLIYND